MLAQQGLPVTGGTRSILTGTDCSAPLLHKRPVRAEAVPRPPSATWRRGLLLARSTETRQVTCTLSENPPCLLRPDNGHTRRRVGENTAVTDGWPGDNYQGHRQLSLTAARYGSQSQELGRSVRSQVADQLDHGCAAKTWATAPPLKERWVLTGSMVSGARKIRSPRPGRPGG